MADAGEMLNEAHYALQNVCHGSTNSKKHAARANSLARRILRKYPDSSEASGARSILRQLGEQVDSPKAQFRHAHSTPVDRHQADHLKRQRKTAAGPKNESVFAVRVQAGPSRFFIPGWPLRLLQAISVVIGVILIFDGSNGLSFARLNTESLLMILAGAGLVYLPRLSVFTEIVAFVKARILVDQNWYAEDRHLPTRQDFQELLSAFVNGNSFKRLVMVFITFFLSGFFVMFSALIYVVGARKVFDGVEGWLLDRE